MGLLYHLLSYTIYFVDAANQEKSTPLVSIALSEWEYC